MCGCDVFHCVGASITTDGCFSCEGSRWLLDSREGSTVGKGEDFGVALSMSYYVFSVMGIIDLTASLA